MIDVAKMHFLHVFTWQARAHWSVAVHVALGIGSARGGGAGVHRLGRGDEAGVEGALHEGVSVVSLVAAADRVVVLHGAGGVDAARAGAGVQAPGVDAGEAGGAVVAQQALGPAAHQRVPGVVTHTLTSIYISWCHE